MKSIKVDYTDPDNRTITIIGDDGDERVLELEVGDSEHSIKVDGEHTIEVDDDTFAVTKATTTAIIKAKGPNTMFKALIGLFICGSAFGLGAFCLLNLPEWIGALINWLM